MTTVPTVRVVVDELCARLGGRRLEVRRRLHPAEPAISVRMRLVFDVAKSATGTSLGEATTTFKAMIAKSCGLRADCGPGYPL